VTLPPNLKAGRNEADDSEWPTEHPPHCQRRMMGLVNNGPALKVTFCGPHTLVIRPRDVLEAFLLHDAEGGGQP
jgi:hypothetical protein